MCASMDSTIFKITNIFKSDHKHSNASYNIALCLQYEETTKIIDLFLKQKNNLQPIAKSKTQTQIQNDKSFLFLKNIVNQIARDRKHTYLHKEIKNNE